MELMKKQLMQSSGQIMRGRAMCGAGPVYLANLPTAAMPVARWRFPAAYKDLSGAADSDTKGSLDARIFKGILPCYLYDKFGNRY
ncbi:MAG: hypothetical protein R2875_10470 [Desulfobacterales bacterium]